MKAITVSIALLMAVTLNAAPAEDAEEKQQEVFDLEFAIPDFEMPEIDMPDFKSLEEHGYDLLAFADDDKQEREKRMHKHAERIQLYRLWKIMEDLDLSEEQVDLFFPLMRDLGKREKGLAVTRRKLVRSMREELSQEKPSEAKLKEMLADLRNNARQMMEEKDEALEKAAKILSVEQQARMALELHEVERNIWESIARVRHMPSGRNWSESGFDKQNLEQNMHKLRERLHMISQELEAKGLPGLDMRLRDMHLDDFDMDKDIHVSPEDADKGIHFAPEDEDKDIHVEPRGEKKKRKDN